jgi:hypothetical protein
MHNLHKKNGNVGKEHVRVLAYLSTWTTIADPATHCLSLPTRKQHWIIKFDNETIDFSTVLMKMIYFSSFFWIRNFPSDKRNQFYSTHIIVYYSTFIIKANLSCLKYSRRLYSRQKLFSSTAMSLSYFFVFGWNVIDGKWARWIGTVGWMGSGIGWFLIIVCL